MHRYCFIFRQSVHINSISIIDCVFLGLLTDWWSCWRSPWYGGPEGHSPVDGSRVRTLTIDQSTIDGWTFKPLIIEHQAHSDDRRSMVRYSNHSSSSSSGTLTIDGRWLGIQITNHSPSSNKCTLTIDGRW